MVPSLVRMAVIAEGVVKDGFLKFLHKAMGFLDWFEDWFNVSRQVGGFSMEVDGSSMLKNAWLFIHGFFMEVKVDHK